jgi:hypothetical protein
VFDAYAMMAWDHGDLVLLFRDLDHAVLRIRRSTDLGATLADLPVEDDPDARPTHIASDGGVTVSAGHQRGLTRGLMMVTTDEGTVVHFVDGYEGSVGIAFAPDHAIVALEGPSEGHDDTGEPLAVLTTPRAP